MATREPGPIRAARMLRADLRRAREAAGLTQSQVADQMEWSLSKVARIENGDVGISDNDLRPLAVLLGISEAAQRELLRRNDASRVRGWWHEYRSFLSPALLTLVGLESEVARVCDYTMEFLPGLLQTTAYAEALIGLADRIDNDDLPDKELLRQRAALRVRRQKEVLDHPGGPELQMVIDESVLYRMVGSAEVMASQMARLAELARRPTIDFRVLPFEREAYCSFGFTLVGTEMVYTERIGDEIVVEDPMRILRFSNVFDALQRRALDADRTGQLLYRVAEHYASGRQPRPWLWE